MAGGLAIKVLQQRTLTLHPHAGLSRFIQRQFDILKDRGFRRSGPFTQAPR